MKKLIVFGSLNLDFSIHCPVLPRRGETIEGSDFFKAAGGKGGNQAVAASKLGADTYMMGKIGNDIFGQELAASLKCANVNLDYVRKDEAGSGIAFIIRSDGDNRIICDYGANHRMTVEEFEPLLRELAQPGDLFLTQLECQLDVTFSLLRIAKSIGMITLLNPAPAYEIPADLYAQIDYLIVNQTECNILTGLFPVTAEDCTAPLKLFYDRGVGVSIITLGKRGSVCRIGDTIHHIPSFKVDAVDTTAAGDAFIGALASSIVTGEEMKDALVFATRAAAMTITRPGAQQAIPDLKELRQFKVTEVII